MVRVSGAIERVSVRVGKSAAGRAGGRLSAWHEHMSGWTGGRVRRRASGWTSESVSLGGVGE
jgi:hypothetical protein